MKIQDIIFVIIFISLLFKRNPRIIIPMGLACYALAMPLFYFSIFFTGERLVMYGSALVILGSAILLFKEK